MPTHVVQRLTYVTHVLGHLRPASLVIAHVNWRLVFPAKLPENPTSEAKAPLIYGTQ
jgi:epoxide hydrolase